MWTKVTLFNFTQNILFSDQKAICAKFGPKLCNLISHDPNIMTLTNRFISSYELAVVIKLRKQMHTLLGVAFIRHFAVVFMISSLRGQALINLCISTHGLWISYSHRIWTTCAFFEKVSKGHFHQVSVTQLLCGHFTLRNFNMSNYGQAMVIELGSKCIFQKGVYWVLILLPSWQGCHYCVVTIL